MSPQKNPFRRWLLLILVVIAVGLAAGRAFFLRVQEDALLREEGETLDSIAVLKVNEVSRWRSNRLAETTAIAANSLFNEQLRPILEGQAGSSADQVREWMQALLRADGEYARVQLVAADDTVRISVPPATRPLSESDRALIDEAFRTRQAVMSDFHIDDPAEGPSLGVAVPLLVGGPGALAPVGALFLRIDPDVYLYPLIQLWPTGNQSGETLLVRRDGADVLYLNELRFQSGTALVLRAPLSQTSLPAAMAVTGRQGMMEGVDYRGVSVIAALRPVQSTPWFMVSKIDRQEALAPLGTLGWLTFGVIVSLLLALAGGVEWVWRRQATTELRRELSLRKERDAQARRAEYFWMYANDSFLLADLTGRIVEANDRAVTTLGYPREQLVGMDLKDLRVPEQRVMVDEVMRLAREAGGYIAEAEYRRGDGSVITVEVSARVIELAGQEYYLSVIRDITERKRAETALRRYTSQLKAAGRLGSLISASFDLSEIFDTLARELASFLPIDRASLILLDESGERWQVARLWTRYEPTLTAGTWGSLADSPIGAVVAGRTPLLEREIGEAGEWPENDLIRKEGIHSRLFLPLIVQGRVIGVLTHGSRTPGAYTEEDAAAMQLFADQLAVAVQNSRQFDEVRRRAAELEQRVLERTAQLEASNKELEAFAYSVSHDLRAPLRAVDGFSRIVLEEYGDKLDAEGKRLLNVVRTSTRQMEQLIADLLELSRTTRMEMRLSAVDMTALAQSVYTELVPPDVRGSLDVSIAPLPEALGDPILLRQVWHNLLENAVKYTMPKEDRRIEVGGYTHENMDVYFVKDNGVGFDPQYTHKLFGAFQRLHRTEEFEGTGIGLAIVQRIVHRHGGRVWAEGEVGAGATFYFALPKRGE